MLSHKWMIQWIVPLCAVASAVSPDPELFSLTGSEGPVSGPEGSSVTLPCGLSPSSSAVPLQVTWYRAKAHRTPVLLYENQQVQGESADPRYWGRVSLVGDLEKGNVSLRLENLTLEDRGEYVCHAKSTRWYSDISISLIVKVLGNIPVVSSTDGEGGQVNVTCESEGWYPDPTLTWRDTKGTEIHQNYTNIHFFTDDEGLASVSSWLLYSPSEAEWLSCSVGLSDQERRESRVALRTTNTHTPTHTHGSWKDPLIAVLFLMLSGLVIWFAVHHRKDVVKLFSSQRKPTGTEGREHKAVSGTNEILKQSETSEVAKHNEHKADAGSNEAGQSDPSAEAGQSDPSAEAGQSDPSAEAGQSDPSAEANEPDEQTPLNAATEQPMRAKDNMTWTEAVVIRISDVEQARKHYVNLSLDMKTVPPFLKLQDSRRSILCPDPLKVLGTEAECPHALCDRRFSSGKHYWEVEVGSKDIWGIHHDRQSWYVGVCSATADHTHRVSLTPQNGFWVLQYETGTGLFTSTEPRTPLPVTNLFHRLGVFLDCDEHTLTFYNVDKKTYLFRLYVAPMKTLIPLISPGVRDKEPIKLCQTLQHQGKNV